MADLTSAEIGAASVIDVQEAQQWIAQERPVVVDLRSPFAYASLHIEGAINIVDELFAELVRGGLPFSRRQPVLLTCPVGEQSARYAALLTRMGHPDVRSLTGGIIAWRDADPGLTGRPGHAPGRDVSAPGGPPVALRSVRRRPPGEGAGCG
nr:rhodanese-like domain-containing protein [Streptomyces chattanoogensis]